jgi:hypothetical protein
MRVASIFPKAFAMSASLGTLLIIAGYSLLILSMIGIGLHAFTGNPIHGVLCLIVPFYLYVYAKRHPVGRALMRAWYAGIVALIAGTVLLS